MFVVGFKLKVLGISFRVFYGFKLENLIHSILKKKTVSESALYIESKKKYRIKLLFHR